MNYVHMMHNAENSCWENFVLDAETRHKFIQHQKSSILTEEFFFQNQRQSATGWLLKSPCQLGIGCCNGRQD